MKTTRFLLTIFAVGALTPGLGYAAEPSSQSSERNPRGNHATSVRPADRVPANREQAARLHPPVINNARASAKSAQAGPIHAPAKHASPNDLHQPGLNKTATAANEVGTARRAVRAQQPALSNATAVNGASLVNKPALPHEPPAPPHESLAKLPVGGGTHAPSPGAVHNRAPAPAAIGGLMAASAKNSGAVINGTGMKHKP